MNAVTTQLPPFLGEKPDPEPKPIRRQSERRVTHMLAPNRDWWPVQTRVDLMVVFSRDLEQEPAFQFAHRHCSPRLGIAALTIRDRAACAASQRVNSPHLRADQALDVAAIAGRSWWAPIDMNAMFLAATNEGLAVELSAIIDMDGPGQAHGRPSDVDAKRFQHRAFVEDGTQEAQPDRTDGGGFEREMQADNHAGVDVDGER